MDDVTKFLKELLYSLEGKDFIEDYEVEVEAFIMKGKLQLKKRRFCQGLLQ